MEQVEASREEPGRVLPRELASVPKEALEVQRKRHQPLSVDIVLQLLEHRPTFARRDQPARDHQLEGIRHVQSAYELMANRVGPEACSIPKS